MTNPIIAQLLMVRRLTQPPWMWHTKRLLNVGDEVCIRVVMASTRPMHSILY